ncbi:esterase [filamentous cyanobacterium CCP5]|nr:esterase [filamentous cyanobacterium CCP5]
MVALITLAISGLGLILSLCIVLPAPIAALLPFAVVAPEISPWLVVVNLLGLGLSGYRLAEGAVGVPGLVVGAISLGLSLTPVVQLPAAQQAAGTAMKQAFGPEVLSAAPPFSQNLRPKSLVWSVVWQGIALEPVRVTTGIQFAAPLGGPLTLDIHQPPQPGLYPAIVLIYGGAWQRGNSQDNVRLARYLAGQGYVVWSISYRHAPKYQFPAQIQDVQAALAFIQTHGAAYESDSTRMALLGKSAGAHLAMLAAYQPGAPPIRAVVNYYGPVNLLNGYWDLPVPDPLDVRSVLRTFLGGAPERVGDRYRVASPSSYIRPGLPPTLLIYGDKDRIVLSKFGQKLAANLEADGNGAALIKIPWADHAFDAVFRGLSNQLALYYTERFLAHVLHDS